MLSAERHDSVALTAERRTGVTFGAVAVPH